MLAFDRSVACCMVCGCELDFYIKIFLHVLVEVGNKGVPVVADRHLGKAEPLDPAINEGPAHLA